MRYFCGTDAIVLLLASLQPEYSYMLQIPDRNSIYEAVILKHSAGNRGLWILRVRDLYYNTLLSIKLGNPRSWLSGRYNSVTESCVLCTQTAQSLAGIRKHPCLRAGEPPPVSAGQSRPTARLNQRQGAILKTPKSAWMEAQSAPHAASAKQVELWSLSGQWMRQCYWEGVFNSIKPW